MKTSPDTPTPAALRFGWLDRWLEPRWRALLTWVVLAALMGLLLFPITIPVADAFNRVLFGAAATYFGLTLPFYLQDVASVSAVVMSVTWFQPLALRLGIRGFSLWLAIAAISSLSLALIHFSRIDVLLVGHFLGIPGLAVIGRRTRPWMSLVAGALATAFLFYARLFQSALWWPLITISHLIFGAVMLYGTDPLPRRPAETQLGEDQR